MRRRTTTTIDVDGIEVELESNPEYFEPITVQPTPETLVVGYLMHDYDCENPMTSCDCEGKLYTEPTHGWGGGSITDDSAAASYLGLADFGNSYNDPTYDLELSGIAERVAEAVKAKIKADPELTAWMVACVMECETPMEQLVEDLVDDNLDGSRFARYGWSSDKDQEMISRLGDYTALAKTAWEDLYAEGKIGEYLAVPVSYCSSNHGPGTASANVTSIGNANAVWVPDACAIENMTMTFPAGATYADKLDVAEKYADGALKQYVMWCNGECYGYVVESFVLEGDSYERVGDTDSCWGFVGDEWAEEALKEQVDWAVNRVKEGVAA